MKFKFVLHGVIASSLLTIIYFGIVSYLQSFSHAIAEFLSISYLIVPLITGFGVQVALYSYARQHLQVIRQGSASVTASGGLSTGAMIACCAHHLTDVAPVLGVAAVASVLVAYQNLFVAIGLLSNIVGILTILAVIQKHQLYDSNGAIAKIMHPRIGRIRNYAIILALIVIVGLAWFSFVRQEGITLPKANLTTTTLPPKTTEAVPSITPPQTTVPETVTLAAKTLSQEGLTIKATPYPLSFSQEVKFKLNFDTHSGSLDFDPAKVTFLEDDLGHTYAPTSWNGSVPGGHHLAGDLSFPPLAGTPSSIKLVVKGVRDVDWLFEWKLAS